MTVTDTAINYSTSTITQGTGFYQVFNLPVGTYTVKISTAGFETEQLKGIPVQEARATTVNATLKVGQVSESVEVSATAALLQAENATVGTVVETKSIVELPLNGREYLNLVTLAPNVSNLAPPSGPHSAARWLPGTNSRPVAPGPPQRGPG